MIAGLNAERSAARVARLGVALGLLTLIAGCTAPGLFNAQPGGAVQPSTAIGTGQVKVALILPLSASGNAGIAALSMKNAAEMALTEFNRPNIQLLVKDDAGTPGGASQAAQQALNEGAELIVGPLFAQSVQAVGQVARGRGIPVIAFSTDCNCRRARHLSAQLSAGVGYRPHRRFRGGQRQALIRGDGAGERLRLGGRGGAAANLRAQGRAHRGAGALSARLDAAGRAGNHRGAIGAKRGRDPHCRWLRRRAHGGKR